MKKRTFWNTGKTIKTISIVYIVLVSLVSFFLGLILWITNWEGIFALLTFGGPVVAFCTGSFMFGFGDMICTLKEIKAALVPESEEVPECKEEVEVEAKNTEHNLHSNDTKPEERMYYCSKCGNLVKYREKACTICGQNIYWGRKNK